MYASTKTPARQEITRAGWIAYILDTTKHSTKCRSSYQILLMYISKPDPSSIDLSTKPFQTIDVWLAAIFRRLRSSCGYIPGIKYSPSFPESDGWPNEIGEDQRNWNKTPQRPRCWTDLDVPPWVGSSSGFRIDPWRNTKAIPKRPNTGYIFGLRRGKKYRNVKLTDGGIPILPLSHFSLPSLLSSFS